MGRDIKKFDELWKKADTDKNGLLSFKEFSMAIFNRILLDSYMDVKGGDSFLKT